MSIVMDKQRITSRFSKAASTYQSAAIVQRQVAEKMITLLQGTVPLRAEKVLEIGCGTGIFSRLLLQRLLPKQLFLNDISLEMITQVMAMVRSQHRSIQCSFICGDAEIYPLPKQLDLITSCSTIQWFENPAAFFARCHTLLHADGILAFSTFGEENMREISTTTQVGLTYSSKSSLVAALLALDYEILFAAEELIRLYFDTPLQVLRHLKQTGVTGIKSQSWTKGKLQTYCTVYTARYAVKTQVSLTYHPVYIIAKKRRSQNKK
nr:malonyl-ACP O-methyltransferase BioC [uncultured Sphingobacterium sp.]